MRGQSGAAGALLAGVVFLPGCFVDDVVLSARGRLEETRPFTPDGTFRLENANGSIRIDTWDQPRVRIEAEKAAADRTALEATRILVEGEGDRVEVRTRHPRRFLFGRSGRVDYHVTLPARARIEVENVNGRLEITGILGRVRASTVNGSVDVREAGGEVDASAVNGSVEARCSAIDPRGRSHLSTTNGSVTLYLPGDASGEFEATTVNGRIRTDFDLDADRRGRRLRGRLGEGDARFELSTVNGSIGILKR
jgi:hypothetical protein